MSHAKRIHGTIAPALAYTTALSSGIRYSGVVISLDCDTKTAMRIIDRYVVVPAIAPAENRTAPQDTRRLSIRHFPPGLGGKSVRLYVCACVCVCVWALFRGKMREAIDHSGRAIISF